MHILIKGIGMPTSCAHCDIACRFFLDRGLDGLLAKICRTESRLPNCPLIPIPVHGRLIDADAAYEQFLNLMDIQGAINPCQLGTILVDATTIIEAEDN